VGGEGGKVRRVGNVASESRAAPKPAALLKSNIDGDIIGEDLLVVCDCGVDRSLDGGGIGITRDVGGKGRVDHE